MGLRRSFKPINQIQNGGFISGVNGWGPLGANPTAGSSIDATKYILGGQSLNITVASEKCGLVQSVDATAGDKIYIFGYVYKTSGDGASFYALPKDTAAGAIFAFQDAISLQSTGIWVKHSGVFATTNAGYQVVVGRPASPATYNCNYDAILTVNLTNILPADLLALSNANLKAWCDLNIPNWFDGTLSGGSFGGIGGLK